MVICMSKHSTPVRKIGESNYKGSNKLNILTNKQTGLRINRIGTKYSENANTGGVNDSWSGIGTANLVWSGGRTFTDDRQMDRSVRNVNQHSMYRTDISWA